MLIEQTTTYAYKLKYLENPSFDKVRDLAKKFIDKLPKEFVDDLYNSINRGVDILKTEPEMLVYLYSFGNMHQAKLNFAFDKIPEEFFSQPEINVIDYGCGQAIGTMCYADFLKSKNYNQQIKSVTLIEPSEICIKRAALHTSVFLPDAKIVTVNKTFDELAEEDINCDEDVPTLHILSNVLDLEFNISKFTKLLKGRLKGYNQYLCVGPYFGSEKKDCRMEVFAKLVGGDISFSKIFGQGKKAVGKSQMIIFSVGQMENNLSTVVTREDIKNGVTDEFGVIYSNDEKRLLRCKNVYLKEYTIKNGTKIICNEAFAYCQSLYHIIFPNSVTTIGDSAFNSCSSLIEFSIPDSVIIIGNEAFGHCFRLLSITIPNSVTVIGNKVFCYCSSLQSVTIPNSITSIGENPFICCKNIVLNSKSPRFVVDNDYLIDNQCDIISYVGNNENVIIPSTVTTIGNLAFSECELIQNVTIPDTVMTIGNEAFCGCKSLQQIEIPDSVSKIGDEAFGWCRSLKKINIPHSIKRIGKNPFVGCQGIELNSESCGFIVEKEFLIDDGFSSYQEHILISYIGNKESVIIPDSITKIGDGAFKSCHRLRYVEIPKSVRTIGKQSFEGCSSLREVSISDYLTIIGDFAFSLCSSLYKITIPNTVTSIGFIPFLGCDSLQQIIIPENRISEIQHMLSSDLWDKLYCLKKVIN